MRELYFLRNKICNYTLIFIKISTIGKNGVKSDDDLKPVSYVKLMRVQHWIKNILIVIPAFFGTMLTNTDTLINLFMGFLVFSLCSSAIYIINDISDIENDRKHPVKCMRPLASGDVSKNEAIILLIILIAAASALNLILCGTSIGCLIPILYLIINLLYSLSLKNKPVVDIVLLVSGFFLRVLYGSAITGVRISGLLYLTVISLSMFLAYGKRRNEKKSCGTSSRKVLQFYSEQYLNSNLYAYMGLFIVFYSIWSLNAGESGVLIYTAPLVMIMMMRYVYTLEIDEHGNPVDMILHDKMLILLGMIYAVMITVLIYFPEAAHEYLRL